MVHITSAKTASKLNTLSNFYTMHNRLRTLHLGYDDLMKIQRKQNRLVRIITGTNMQKIRQGMSLVKQLGLQSIAERRDYFLAKHTFQSVHGLAPDYLTNRVIMRLDIHPHDTRSSRSSDVHPRRVKKEIFRRSLEYSGAICFNSLPSQLKNCTSVDSFKTMYRRLFMKP